MGSREIPSAGNEIELIPQGDVKPTSSSLQKVPSRTTKVIVNDVPGKTILNPVSNDSNGNDDDIQIFTIFRNKHIDDSMNENINMSTLNVPIDEQPCSSKHGLENVYNNLSSDSDELPDRNNWLYLRYEMITELLSSIQDENLYINHFKRLISFEEAVKKGDDSWTIFKKKKRQKGKYTKMIVKDLVSLNEIKLSKEFNNDIETDGSDGIVNLEFGGDFEDRIKMRKKMINHHSNTRFTIPSLPSVSMSLLNSLESLISFKLTKSFTIILVYFPFCLFFFLKIVQLSSPFFTASSKLISRLK
jgi:hypothetical protein